MSSRPCRSCGGQQLKSFLSLGTTPLADALRTAEQLREPEARYPLEVAFCPECGLVQILEDVPPKVLFVDNYLYFSSFSDRFGEHARRHAAWLVDARELGADDLVVEIASNDGYLLRHVAATGVPVLGIDPAPDQAAAARQVGVPTTEAFFDLDLARQLVDERGHAAAIVANNVMAHVPDLNGFVAGMAHLLADDGLITVENPSVRDLIDKGEFDTIYHEHHCYFSCTAVDNLVRRHGLSLNHVEHFPDLHGGTLRWHLSKHPGRSAAATAHLEAEAAAGLTSFDYYADFSVRVQRTVAELRDLLRARRASGRRIAAYGAAAKGSTLLSALGVGVDVIDFVVDRNPHKQGRYMPGGAIPIRDPQALQTEAPDDLLLLAWNFADEIMSQQQAFRDAGGRFILPIPEPKVVA